MNSLRKRLSNVENSMKHYQASDSSRTPDVSESLGEGVWRIKPVPVLEFAETHLGLVRLSDPERDVLQGIFGDDPESAFFNVEQAILRVGQGGGKNLTSTIACVYTFYLWCCLADPHKFFDLQYHESFNVLNFSQVSERQARNVFFRELSTMMKNVRDPQSKQNWFTQHIGFQVKEFGRGDVKERELTIPNRHPNRGGISVFCLDSEARTVAGQKY